MSRWNLPCLALATLLALGLMPVAAQPVAGLDDEDDIPADHVFARAAVARGEFLPLEAILEIVGQNHPGQVVEVELELDDGVWEYEIEIVTLGGRVIEVDLAASDGRILEVEDEDEG